MKCLWGWLVIVVILCSSGSYSAHGAFPQLHLEVVTEDLGNPIGLTNAGDGSDRLFALEQDGKIMIIKNNRVLATPFLDIGFRLISGTGEKGLLGLAFHPDYEVSTAPGEGKFYVYYSAPRPGGNPNDPVNPIDHMSVIAEYSVLFADADIADTTSERILLTIDQPQGNHNAGQLDFGPDGFLYIATGDGGGGGDNWAGHTGGSGSKPSGVLGNGQDTTNLLGKILRVDPFGTNGSTSEYGIPPDNPFVGEGGGVREEIYAYGFRNPWRFSFDNGPGGSGRLFVGDVGQGAFEEIDIVDSGANYGWRIREGAHDYDPTVPNPGVPLIGPIAEYSHPGVGIGQEIGRTVIGGYVYRGSEIPALSGKYIFADWSNTFVSPGNGTLLGLEETAPGVWNLTILQVGGGNPIGLFINSLGEDESGELYIVARGAIFKIIQLDTYVLPISIEHDSANGYTRLTWPDILGISFSIFWTNELSSVTIWDNVDGAALLNLIDNGNGTWSWTDDGTDSEMAGQAPGDVPVRFYKVR